MEEMNQTNEKELQHYKNLIQWVAEDPERAFKLGNEMGCDRGKHLSVDKIC